MRKITLEIIKIVLIFIPIVIFAVLYFVLGKWPNYLFNSVDTQGLYNAELSLFGIQTGMESVVTPSEFFAAHHNVACDLLSGVFYLLWVPLPLMYILVLHLQGHDDHAIRTAAAFLTVNVIGFVIYYIHPASPPWYVMEHGFDVNFNTPGDVAGFKHFDEIVGFPVFHSIYCHNANVFASIPSLHAAYNPVAFFYAMKIKHNNFWRLVLGVVSVGIWLSAVYSGHHYIIDVLLGICTSIGGIALFECVIRKTKAWKYYEHQIVKVLCAG